MPKALLSSEEPAEEGLRQAAGVTWRLPGVEFRLLHIRRWPLIETLPLIRSNGIGGVRQGAPSHDLKEDFLNLA
ncbi:hypothetical protein FFK22_007685 [Mycobacterium sp. KBS0706]|uniref:hypothetical protein n=1 Tax=Mycobacterium sp. KBS0706 TaxID=2578109 RepID=UPI00110FC4BC|nr:hypothetical protein [Mycobacterium sp. KBS0706]TSD89368.1 hypothetical protein FFK22_007685 [Mycobacterium sp. KBS0706]